MKKLMIVFAALIIMGCVQTRVIAQNGVSVIWEIERILKDKETQWQGVRLTLPAGVRSPICPAHAACGSGHTFRWKRDKQVVSISIFIGDSKQEAVRELERSEFHQNSPPGDPMEGLGEQAYQHVFDGHSWVTFRKSNVTVTVDAYICASPKLAYKYSAEAVWCKAKALTVATRFAQEIAEQIAAA